MRQLSSWFRHHALLVFGGVLAVLAAQQFYVARQYEFFGLGFKLSPVWAELKTLDNSEYLYSPTINFWFGEFGNLNISHKIFSFYLSRDKRASLDDSLEHQSAPKKITVYYGAATTPLNYLFLPAFEQGDFDIKVYSIHSFSSVGDEGKGELIWLASDYMRKIGFMCGLGSVICLSIAYKKWQKSKP